MSLTDDFVEIIYQLSRQDMSDELMGICRQKLIDYSGVTVAGAKIIGAQLQRHPGLTSSQEGNLVPVIGTGKFATMETAALLNSMSAHVAELDDGERFGMVHPGAPVISALISILFHHKLTNEEFLKGIFIGYEASIRMARLLQPELKDNGYHATGPCGCIGATMAVAAALNFDKVQMKSAFSAAVTSASGILKVIRDNSELKPYNAGQAAMNGLVAATVASIGFKGPGDVLEGSQGFIKMITGNTSSKEIEGIEHYLIKRAYVKPYAACRHCHAPIEAGISLLEQNKFSSSDIIAIKVITHRFAAFNHEHTDIDNTYSAKMSIPFSVAVALRTGRAGLNEFSDTYIDDPETLRLTSLVSVEVDEALTQQVPGKRIAIVELMFDDGKSLSQRVDFPLGEPENEIGKPELLQKVLDLLVFSGVEKLRATDLADELLMSSNIRKSLLHLSDSY
jgi:2-methylcitrate dehydratase PrpD